MINDKKVAIIRIIANLSLIFFFLLFWEFFTVALADGFLSDCKSPSLQDSS